MQQVLRLEPGIELLRILHAAKKQPRSHKRHQRQRNFRNHQQAPQTVVRPAQHSASPSDFQNFVDVRAGSFNGRDDSEDQAGYQRNKQSESQDTGIEGKINRAVEKKRRPEGPQHIAAPVRHQQSGQAAEQRKHRAFGQKLADQPEASCTHRRANAQFFFAFGGLREQ